MAADIFAMQSAALNHLPGVRSPIQPSVVTLRHSSRHNPAGAHECMTTGEKCYNADHGTKYPTFLSLIRRRVLTSSF
jgi:hypothetical protein